VAVTEARPRARRGRLARPGGVLPAGRGAALPAERDGLAYVGLLFGCLRQWEFGYEHGAGIVLFGDRVVRFGVAEVAKDEGAALADKKRGRRR
jgi:hypothetical protein